MVGQSFSGLNLEHGCFIAACQAHNRFYSNQAIFSGFSHLDPQVFAQLGQKLIGAAQCTGQVVANLDTVFPAWIFVVEGVKTDNGSNIGAGNIQYLTDISSVRLFGYITRFSLSEI
jgi:hypothetical protein